MNNWNITFGNISVIHLIILIQIMLLTFNKHVFRVVGIEIESAGLLKTS